MSGPPNLYHQHIKYGEKSFNLFTIAFFRRGPTLPHFLRFGSVNMPHIPLGPCIHFYWVDERCVPPGDDQSNFGLAYRLLFSKVGIPASHYYRIVGEGAPEEEAKQYSSIVKTTVPTVDGVPVFDFVLLGIGEDGIHHPFSPTIKELLTAGEPYEVSVNPYNKTVRICMTGRPLIEARHTCFLVTGENKCSILKEILDKNKEGVYPESYILASCT